MEIFKAKLELNGKTYTLQHPGNRAWVKLQSEILNATKGSVDAERLLDYAFEHVVLPEQGPRLSLDTIDVKEIEEWQAILPPFLRGSLAAGYTWRQDKPGADCGAADPGSQR